MLQMTENARGICCGLMLWSAGLTVGPVLAESPTTIVFNQQIRPLLSDRCFQCHGPDEKRRETDLRLDTFEGATQSGAIVPGNPEASEILRRILSHDPDEQMPPPSAKKRAFTRAEIALLTEWIKAGATYQGHWAFLPIRDTPPPELVAGWGNNSIDAFVGQQLQQAGLTPSVEADRATLIRRVTLDLIGLLPTPEEVEEFRHDPDPAAYEQLVERLLASPHYGERWGRHWLDQARYADSNGYSIDGPREMWPYRDWVIAALNHDLPFDQFTIEQLSGDLLPSPTKSQLIATGFHRNTLINQEGGTDPEQFRVEAAMDRTNTTGAVWLGLTVGCAQCHTHKYDPLTQQEYYELLTFFNSGQDVNNTGASMEVVRGEMFGQPVHVQRELPGPSSKQIADWRTAWEQTTRERLEKLQPESGARSQEWRPLTIVQASSSGKATFRQLEDGSLLATSPPAPFDRYEIEVTTDLPEIVAIRLRVLPDPSLPKNGPGRAGNGNFVLTRFELSSNGQAIPLAIAAADHEQPKFPIRDVLDDDAKSGWAINVGPGSTAKMNAPHEAVFVLAEPRPATGQHFEVQMHHEVHANYLVGRFLLEGIASSPVLPNDQDTSLLAALKLPEAERSPEQKQQLLQAFETAEPRAKKKVVPPNPDIAKAMVMRDLSEPRESYLLTRGDFTRPDKDRGRLYPGVFASISPQMISEPTTRNRLDLAKWLVDPDHPLTTRVTMNRIWMRYFGRGLVETEEDFGTQGTPPTHPELLDWLAREFQRQGWSQKAMHRLIVTSATYRQSSVVRKDLVEKDPRNLLLGRQSRLRLDAEVIRDVSLSASGLLYDVFGGPSVYPPQPDGVYAFTQVKKNWPTETGPQRYRRTLYTFFYRSAPYPLLTTFDSPDFQSVCTRRIRSNTPLQALTLANDAAFLELSQGLALRAITDRPGSPDQQLTAWVERVMEVALGRSPSSEERELLVNYARQSRQDLEQDASSADALTTPALRAATSPPAAAALVLVARAVMNTDNFITRE